MPGSLRVGRIAGIAIEIHFSWLIILVFLAWSLAVGWFPAYYPGWTPTTYWILGVIASLLLFVSVLAHELAHSLVARARGLPVRSITLFVFGGVSNLEREPTSPGVEFIMAFVGPLTSLIIGAICWLIGLRLPSNPVQAVLMYLGITNILLGVFNLIPGFPLDGGRVLRSIIWGISHNMRLATRIAARVGIGIALLFILAGIWYFFTGNVFSGIWIGFVGWFLLQASQAADAQAHMESLLRGATVGQVMNPNPVVVPPYITVRTLVDEQILSQGQRAVAVVEGDRFVGLVTLGDVRHVPRDAWDRQTVRDIMIPRDRVVTAHPDQDLNTVLPLMVNRDINQIPVVVGDQLVGMLSRDRIVQYMEIRRGLENPRTPPPEERRPWPPAGTSEEGERLPHAS